MIARGPPTAITTSISRPPCLARAEAVISAVSPGSGIPDDSSPTSRPSTGYPTFLGTLTRTASGRMALRLPAGGAVPDERHQRAGDDHPRQRARHGPLPGEREDAVEDRARGRHHEADQIQLRVAGHRR